MSYRKLLILYSLILIFLVTKTMHGEDHDDPAGPTHEAPAATGAFGEPRTLTREEENLLAKVFHTSPRFIHSRYHEDLPRSLDLALQKDGTEEGVAKNIATLFGSMNDRQIENLKITVTEAKFDPKHAKDERFVNLMDRLFFAASLIIGPEDKEWDKAYPKFKMAFLEQWNKVRDKNKKFYSLLKEAMGTDPQKKEEAKKALRSNYDRGSLLGFIDAQRKTGNHKLANDLSQALSFDSVEGKPFIDAIGPDRSSVRVLLDEDANRTIAKLSEANHGLEGFTITEHPHEGPVNLFSSTTERSPNEPTRPKHAEEVKAIFAENCTVCHDPDNPHFKLDEDGKALSTDKVTLQKVIAAIHRKKTSTKPRNMPPSGDLDDETKQMITEWAKSLGAE